ncbi:helix-turn-helix domain-containing protein [Nocardia uniformis]|uniref:Helix-turn-helix domain-containing protein n=1 Tax=Nocardia uniformis TaxID=53432 RepID=A0A849CEE8_9NOCA|nr:helix-turn-helix domain-containing protein [Nocardia uniformis]NNH74687.1 helix-turn-helix domain-containing protein [Nocardia uniformis]
MGTDIAARAAVFERLRQRATALVGEFSADAPPYDAIPHSMLDADFVVSAKLNIALFFRYLVEGFEPTSEDTQPLVDRVVNLVHDGMPLTESLTNYRVGSGFFWSELMRLLDPGEYPVIPELGLRLTEYLSLIMSRIANALVEDARQPRWDLLERQREIADALLTGRDPSGWAHDPEVPIADAFLIAVVRLGEPTPGTLTGLRSRIADLPGTLLHRDSGGWTALVPMPEPDGDPVGALAARLAIRDTGPHPQFWIGVAPAPTHTDVPAAYAEARAVAEVARCLHQPAVVCRQQDMMFEYAIATAGPARRTLAALLAPLDDQPVLAQTLDAFIDNQFNHNAVARALFIHRNTVTYRLARISEMTGYDPLHPTGISTLMAARTARRLESKSLRL